ncbi:MAG: ABC transporter substrate-binding protein, partial [Gemmatimonadota bacterium]
MKATLHGIPPRLPLLLLVLACFGCAEQGPDASADTEPVRGGTVVLAGPNDLDVANSLVSTERYTQELLRYVLALPLLYHGPDLELQPALAESWELLADTGVVFHLRPDVHWHDGVPTRAGDVAFTFARAMDPATGYPSADYFARWSEPRVVDSLTVRFTWEPHAEALAGVPFLPVMPAHLLDRIPADRMRQAAFNRAPVGNGPFRFVEYRAGDRWVFAANDDFPEALGGRPWIDRLVWRVIPEAAAQEVELRTSNAHMILSPRAPELAELDALPGIRAIVRPGRQYGFVAWNGQRPPLDDPAVRRALTMALDRERMIEGLRSGYGEPAVGPIGPFHWSVDEGLEPLPQDPAAARTLLEEAGIRDRDGDGYREDAAGAPLR